MLNRCTHLISLSSPKPRRIMDVDMWLSLPPDLFLEIFCRLEAAAALRCTRVCKPWQHTILGSAASYLRPRPYFFVPGLFSAPFFSFVPRAALLLPLRLLLCTLFFLGTGSFNGNEMHTAICQGAVHSSQPTSKLILHVVEKMIMCGDELRTVRRSSQPNRLLFHL